MPARVWKRHCCAPGCKAWAMRGRQTCYAHRRREPLTETQQTIPAEASHAAANLLAISQRELPPALDDLQVVEDELRQLRAARGVVAEWVDVLCQRGWEGGTPAQFLRAWSDSARQMVQLLRARRELGVQEANAALLDAAYDLIEENPGVAALKAAEPEQADDAG